jgi:biopolymer transport protein ExbD
VAVWDVYHTDRMEVEHGLSTAQLREAVTQGQVRLTDLFRPAGSSAAWSRVADAPDLSALAPPPPQPESGAVPEAILLDEDAPRQSRTRAVRLGASDAFAGQKTATMTVAEAAMVAPEEADDPLAEDEEASEFTLAPEGTGRHDDRDLDLAAMVDVAMQMVMFFMVTAATIVYKSLEIPPPKPESAQAAQQTAARTVEDLQNDNILVEIDPNGQVMVDHEPIAPDNLVAKMRAAREATGRTAMLLMADLATPHRNAVRAYDAANELGLEIKVGRPASEPE